MWLVCALSEPTAPKDSCEQWASCLGDLWTPCEVPEIMLQTRWKYRISGKWKIDVTDAAYPRVLDDSFFWKSTVLFSESVFFFSSRRLDANHINYVPPNCFNGLVSLRHLWLDDNSLTEIPIQAFRSLPALQAMTLALNKIHYIPDYAFGNLSSLVVL